MSVWSFEAAEIADGADIESRPIYFTPDIDDFLRFQKSPKRIISGLKGTGKTLFLKLISHHCRRLSGFTCIPTNQLTERLYSIDYDFSGERAKAWVSIERWKHVWRTVLAALVLKAVKQDVGPTLRLLFPDELGLSVGAHLTAAVRSRAVSQPQFQELFPDTLDAAIQRISQPVALFLDNIDEALARHSGYDLYRDSIERQTQLGTHSYGLWLAAQIGFVLATRELSARNEHLKLFGTIRTEALRDNPTPTAFNTQSFVLDLRYAPADLREIFKTKLRQLQKTFPQAFPRPNETDPIKAFFLDDRIEHQSVTDVQRRPFQEDVFEYLRRHTRGRPRELDFIGHRLQMIRAESRSAQAIRECVRDLSYQFFGYARNEAVPYWNPKVDELLEKIPSNFVVRRDAERIATRLPDGGDARGLWDALYQNGLCGAVVKVHPEGMVQRFCKHDSGADLSAADFHSAGTWVLHPCVNIATRPRRNRYRPYGWSVAGHAYPFSRPPRRRRHVHVLVGAGKLGFGLVVPALLADDGTRVLVVARASDTWRPLLEPRPSKNRSLEVRYFAASGQPARDFSVGLRVFSDASSGWLEDLRREMRRNRCVLLVMSDDASLSTALALGDSIGVSVGPKELPTVAARIAAARLRGVPVLAYENDAEGMQLAAATLARGGITMVPTVVDRICVERTVRPEVVAVRAESYGSITALAPPGLLASLPPAFQQELPGVLRAVTDPTQFAFVREKKKRLVNSMHAAAAALVHRALMEVGAKPETANDLLLGLLTKNMDIDSQLVGVQDLMILAVLGTLPAERLAREDLYRLIRELNDYGDLARKRMEGPDAPSRVLRMDPRSLASKYERLFADVCELALQALRHEQVRAALPMDEREIVARLNALAETFMRLVARADRQQPQG